MEHIKIEIKGKFTKYAELTAEQGYCFYDVDDAEEQKQYMEYIATPIIDYEVLKSKYIVVQGNAEELNKKITEVVSNE